jgi:hypothetical protein
MSTNDVAAAIVPVLKALEQLNVPHYIGGSVASSVIGEPRATLDVDVVAALGEEQAAPLAEILGEDYFADAVAMRQAIRQCSSFNLIHFGTFLKIDVFAPKPREYDTMAMSRRELHRLGREADAPEAYIAAAEDILLAKLEWYRLGGESSDRQWRDILGICKIQFFDLDIEYLEHWAGELRVETLLRRALEEAKISDEDLG